MAKVDLVNLVRECLGINGSATHIDKLESLDKIGFTVDRDMTR